MKSVSTLDVSCLIYSRFHNGISKQNVRSVFSRRNYSTSHSADSGACNLPLPVLTISNLNNKDCIKSYRRLLKDKGGIYSFINLENGNQYIGSAKDFYLRLNEHLGNKKSNVALQSAFTKYGLDKFKSQTLYFVRLVVIVRLIQFYQEIYIMKSILVRGFITKHLPFL